MLISSSTISSRSVKFCWRRTPHLWQYLASSEQFRPQEEQNIFKFEAGNNMASMKSCISPDLLSHDARVWNFTLFLQQLSFYFQQPLKQLQKVSLLCSKFHLFLKRYLNFFGFFSNLFAVFTYLKNIIFTTQEIITK